MARGRERTVRTTIFFGSSCAVRPEKYWSWRSFLIFLLTFFIKEKSKIKTLLDTFCKSIMRSSPLDTKRSQTQ